MVLTVETGSIVAGADSYVTLAVFEAYATSRGWTVADTDAANEVNLRRAFDVLNRKYAYRGEKVDEGAQIGAWPRYIVKSRWEYVTPANDIPQAVKDAQCELAHLIQGGLDPFATVAGVVLSERSKAGPVEVETTYTGGLSTPRIVAVEGLLAPFLASGRGQAAMVRG